MMDGIKNTIGAMFGGGEEGNSEIRVGDKVKVGMRVGSPEIYYKVK